MLLFPKLNQTRQTLHRIRPPSLQLHLFIWQKVACEHNPAMMAVNVIEERTWEGRNIISRRQGCLFNTQTLDKTKQNTSSFRIIFVHWYIGLLCGIGCDYTQSKLRKGAETTAIIQFILFHIFHLSSYHIRYVNTALSPIAQLFIFQQSVMEFIEILTKHDLEDIQIHVIRQLSERDTKCRALTSESRVDPTDWMSSQFHKLRWYMDVCSLPSEGTSVSACISSSSQKDITY